MLPQTLLHFPPFRLDSANAQLWRGDEELELRRKTFEVLRYLVEHPGRLVTKEALLDAVWASISVSDSMPAICVGELRKALGDDAKHPKFIETAHGRGYRFVAQVTTTRSGPITETPNSPVEPLPIVVGRGEELARLRRIYSQMSGGRRRVIFVAGEAGIGKTTFVRTFLDSLPREPQVLIARGQCIQQYGAGEPYMPILEALTRLAHQSGDALIKVLNQFAPSWLVQMPSLLSEAERAQLRPFMQDVTQPRMLREMGAALDALAAATPLVLILEDLHWSDFSTLELIAALARRSEAARLLLIGTYRPVEILATEHPLRTIKSELELHQQCEELRLKLLDQPDVAAYLKQRLASAGDPGIPPSASVLVRSRDASLTASEGSHENDRKEHAESSSSFPRTNKQDVQQPAGSRQTGDAARGIPDDLESLASTIHARTEGNPLFMVNLVDHLVEHDSMRDAQTIDAPSTIQQMIEHNLERLTFEEQAMLEAASVAGAEFSAAAVAAALELPTSEIETRCSRLARQQQFIEKSGVGEWPDGTVAATFRFHHALYTEALYKRVPAGRRTELHRKIAHREEAAHGDHARSIAAELAHHYDQAKDHEKAIRYHQLAGQRSLRRSAHHEAQAHFAAALRLLELTPQPAGGARLEIRLCLDMVTSLIATRGYTAPAVAYYCNRARELASAANPREQFGVLGALGSIYSNRGELHAFRQVAEQMLQIAQRLDNPVLLVWAHYACGFALHDLGEIIAARSHLEQSYALYDPQLHDAYRFTQDPGATGLTMLSFTLFELGYPDRALETAKRAVALAREIRHQYSIAYTLAYLGELHNLRGEYQATEDIFAETIELADDQDFTFLRDLGRIWRGWALVAQGQHEAGLSLIMDGFEAYRHEDRANDERVYNLFTLASAYRQLKRYSDAIPLVEQMMIEVEKTGKRGIEADLLRLRAELLLDIDTANTEQAYRGFEHAIEVSQVRSRKSDELRATTSLARLLVSQGRGDEAHARLANIYDWFTEGFDTLDLREAKALLDSWDTSPPRRSKRPRKNRD